MQIKFVLLGTVTIAHQSVGMVAPQPGTSDHADLCLTRSRSAERSWSVAEEEVVESVATLGLLFFTSLQQPASLLEGQKWKGQ